MGVAAGFASTHGLASSHTLESMHSGFSVFSCNIAHAYEYIRLSHQLWQDTRECIGVDNVLSLDYNVF